MSVRCVHDSYRTEPLNESSVEITKPDETLNIPLILWYGPISYRRNFGGVHLQFSMAHNGTEVIY